MTNAFQRNIDFWLVYVSRQSPVLGNRLIQLNEKQTHFKLKINLLSSLMNILYLWKYYVNVYLIFKAKCANKNNFATDMLAQLFLCHRTCTQNQNGELFTDVYGDSYSVPSLTKILVYALE